MMNTIGYRIKKLRLNKDLSQQELANLVGVTNVSVSQWERGETEPRGKQLPKLCQALSTTIDWLTLSLKEPRILAEDEYQCIEVPFYPEVRAAGGWGYMNEDEDEDEDE
ncbi:helix-turn-helix domain-containing protein, partial [Vibrio splendidus]